MTFADQRDDSTSTLYKFPERTSYDYIIIGGGTAGSLLASRLSEDEDTTVLVLEAGQLHDKDRLIDKPNEYLHQFFQPSYDWGFKTVPQTHLSGRSISWSRGKGLGGSSNLNFLQWTRPTKVDIDAWQRLGNPGWTWDNLLPYFKKSEKFHPESESHLSPEHVPLDPSWFGKDGEIPLSYSDVNSAGLPELKEVYESFGIPAINHSFGGNNLGLVTPVFSIDPATRTRASAYTSFLRPHLSRPNLTILTGATVSRIITTREKVHPEGESLTAEAVEFILEGQTHRIDMRREVILCAGTLKSPQILELSGIGNPEILTKAGIEVELPLVGVGENLQDHTFIQCLCFEMKDDATKKIPYEKKQADHVAYLHSSALAWVPFQTFKDKNGREKVSQLLSELVSESKSAEASTTEDADAVLRSIKEQYNILADNWSNPRVPVCEILTSHRFGGYINAPKPGKSYLTFSVGGIYPWSRGSVHTNSNDPLEDPEIDANYFEKDIDLEILLEGVKFLRGFQNNPVFRDIINEEINPGPTVETDEELRDATGTLSMLPREKGGVVDPALKVWGTNNIRVADLSIIPLTVSVHTQSTAYVIAEIASDIIRGRISRL